MAVIVIPDGVFYESDHVDLSQIAQYFPTKYNRFLTIARGKSREHMHVSYLLHRRVNHTELFSRESLREMGEGFHPYLDLNKSCAYVSHMNSIR